MTRMMRILGISLLYVGGCLDETPIVVEPKTVSLPLHDECMACLSAPEDPGPGCGPALQACLDHVTCGAAFRYCTTSKPCIGGALDTYLACLPECTQVGHISTQDPGSAEAALELFQCFAQDGPCASHCFLDFADGGVVVPADAGPELDASAPPDATVCDSASDKAIIERGLAGPSTECGMTCFGDPDAHCNGKCLAMKTGLSSACADCWGDVISCGATNCILDCLSPESQECTDCNRRSCSDVRASCGG